MALREAQTGETPVRLVGEVKSAAEFVGQIIEGPVFIDRVVVDKASNQLVALTAVSIPRFGAEAFYTDEIVDNPPTAVRQLRGVLLDKPKGLVQIQIIDGAKNVHTATYNIGLNAVHLHFQAIVDPK